MPDLGSTPLFLGTQEAAAISAASQAFNSALGPALAQLQTALPQTEIVAFESDALFVEILSEPERFGLENVTQSCLANAVICDPERWFFWDDFHPTTAGHRLIAERWVAAVAEPVPGPLGLLAPPLMVHWSRRLRRRIQLPKNQP
jgi:phospholipase/lecithinase/hemolysin